MEILDLLSNIYPNTKIALNFGNNWELLVAVQLSAQCTDKRVNFVTSALFKKYKNIKDYACANAEEFEQDIRSTGFYRNKARNIIGAAKMILKDFGGEVPSTMEDLLKLPGVARKTANIILWVAFGRNEGIAVDTHVKRISKLLGLTKETDPLKIERDLMNVVPQKDWGCFSLMLVRHGRETCVARKPKCIECVLNKVCPSAGFGSK